MPRQRSPERTLVGGLVVGRPRQQTSSPQLCGAGAQEFGQQGLGKVFRFDREGAVGELPRPPTAGEVAERFRLGEAAADDERVGRDPFAGVSGRGLRLV